MAWKWRELAQFFSLHPCRHAIIFYFSPITLYIVHCNLRPYLGNIFLILKKLQHFFNYMAVILATYRKDYSNYILDLRIRINLNRDIGIDI